MKLTKRITAMILCLAALCSFAACSREDPDNKAAVGTWLSDEIEFGEYLNESIAGADAEMAEYYDFSGIKLSIEYSLNGDKTYAYSIEDSCRTAYDEKVRAAVAEGAQAQFGALGTELNMTADEVLAATGYGSVVSFTDAMMESFGADAFSSGFERSGSWLMKDGKLITTDTPDESIAENGRYVLYTLDGDTLTLDVPDSYDGADSFLYPISFTRK